MSDYDPPITPECVWPLGAQLGEGPFWDSLTRCLWFVDILAGLVHCFDPLSGRRETIAVDGMPAFILPLIGGGFVLGNVETLQRFDGTRVTGEIARLELPPRHRLNDATVDSSGRLWFGSMDMDNVSATGVVHVHDAGQVRVAGGPCVITNGPAVSGDGRWLYHVDTLGGSILRFDLAEGAVLEKAFPFVSIDPADGSPDGVTIDSEDHVWVALWGGWCLRRYAPDGWLVQTLEMPCANVTKVAFGGADLKTAFITTARTGLDAADLISQPEAGGVFACRVNVPGRVTTSARIE